VMSIYFRVFPKNGTAKPAMSWYVMGFPAISTEMAGQRGGGYIGTNNTVFSKIKYSIFKDFLIKIQKFSSQIFSDRSKQILFLGRKKVVNNSVIARKGYRVKIEFFIQKFQNTV
jgi:hypothetical protein